MDKNELFAYMEKQKTIGLEEIYSWPEQRIRYLVEYFQFQNIELTKQLASQESLNRNLIRISIERKTQEYGKKCKDNGFQLEKITELLNYRHKINNRLKLDRCYKLHIKTPYTTEAFDILAVKRQFQNDFMQLLELTGDMQLLNIYQADSILKENINNFYNYFWDEYWEADFTKKCWYISFICLNAPLNQH